MFILYDKFNGQEISRHYTREAAESADRRHQRAVKKANGPKAYIPTVITADNGEERDAK